MAWPDLFDLRARKSTLPREIRGGVATFLTMAYILVANPSILIAAGIPKESAIATTALAAGVCSILMGLLANFPIALAAGMGLNAVIAFQVMPLAGTWQRGMGLVVLDGLLVLLLVLFGLRESVMRAIPRDLRLSIGAGIGLFIAFIGLTHARLVVSDSATLVGPGHLRDPITATSVIGLVLTSILLARKVRGALIIGIISTTLVGLFFHVTQLPTTLFSRPDFQIAFQADVAGALANLFRHDPVTGHIYPYLLPILLSVVMVDFFDTLGTITAVAEEGNILDEKTGQIPHLRRILIVDSISASIGGMLGCSSNTSYIESAAGVAEGARTGIHSIVVGLLFLASLFLAPLVSAVPDAATAPALILVGFLMTSQLARINFDQLDTAIPSFIILLTIPLTFSIAHGIGYGFITFSLIKLLSFRPREAHPLMYATAAAFAAYFLWGVA
ncbi:MAG TPA: NCS2 family permease [Tepidisphaeraceae bacterium]|jgi:AGZA family xanthine/uracil permease-like MFS transporter|nr:NCS2 family permease [Tepidisphaeraceae bacterium]